MNTLKPSDLLALHRSGMKTGGPASVDTETSGLFADDGARASTVSVAWEDIDGEWMDFLEGNSQEDRVTWGIEEHAPGQQAMIVSIAWPFDQGVEGKPEDNGQERLWPDAENLPEEEWVALIEWLVLVGEEFGLTFHHAKFDCEKFRVGTRHGWAGKDLMDLCDWDTQNGCDLLWPTLLDPTTNRFTNSLKPTYAALYGVEETREAEEVKTYLRKSKLPAGRWDLIPWSIIGKYADKDARMTCVLRLRQEWDIENHKVCEWLWGSATEVYVDEQEEPIKKIAPDVSSVYEKLWRRLETSKVLYRMEWRGLPYDEATSREAADMCRERAAALEPQLPFEPTINAAKEFFFSDAVTPRGHKGLDMVPYSVTEKGAPQLTAEILARMVDDDIPHAQTWAEWSKVSSAASMWYEGYADKMGQDGRLRCAFRQNGTVSTRFSVERINLQAIPQDYRLSEYSILDGIPTPRDLIKSAVSTMPEWKSYELDLAQAELRVGAMFAECERMLQMIHDGADLHTFTTKALFPDVDPDDPLFESKWRQVGKRGNFSLQFGSGWDTFAKMVSKETGIILPEYEARRIVKDWNALYPEYNRAIKKHQAKVVQRQVRHKYAWLEAANHERRWFSAYEEAHKSFNQRVQANLAQFAIDWMLRTDHYLRSQGLDDNPLNMGGLILTIHDSQMLLLPAGPEGEKMAETCANFGRELWKDMFPGVPGDVTYHD